MAKRAKKYHNSVSSTPSIKGSSSTTAIWIDLKNKSDTVNQHVPDTHNKHDRNKSVVVLYQQHFTDSLLIDWFVIWIKSAPHHSLSARYNITNTSIALSECKASVWPTKAQLMPCFEWTKKLLLLLLLRWGTPAAVQVVMDATVQAICGSNSIDSCCAKLFRSDGLKILNLGNWVEWRSMSVVSRRWVLPRGRFFSSPSLQCR